MIVNLISMSNMGEWLAAAAAAVCTNSVNASKSLVQALNSGHDSVMEHVSFTFEISGVSRALLAQLTRHRIASFSVQSQRYVSYEDEMEYVTPPSIVSLGEEAVEAYDAQMKMMHAWYCEWRKQLGKEKQEDARFVLPNATTTKLIMTMNAREIKHFLSLRECNKAQWEIRELAERIHALVEEETPLLFANAGPGCVRGRCPEGSRSCGNPRERVSK